MASETSRTPSMAELLRAAIEARLLDVHTSIPGRVEKVETATQTVDVKPLIKRLFANEDGSEVSESLPIIPRVPLAFPRAGKFFITWPIKKGDLVELVFTETSRDAFKAGDAEETDPDDFRRFDITDAVAYPSGYPESKALKDFDPDDLVVGIENGVQIHINESGEIHLGSKTAADALALASKVEAGLQDIVDAIKAGVPGASDGGAALQTTIVAALTDPVAAVGSTIVKAE